MARYGHEVGPRLFADFVEAFGAAGPAVAESRPASSRARHKGGAAAARADNHGRTRRSPLHTSSL